MWHKMWSSLYTRYLLSLTDQFGCEAADGLKYYDLVEGKGPVAEKGSIVQVRL